MLIIITNDPPEVRITTPEDGGSFDWNAAIRYEISVSDKEDGASAYDEIASREVMMQVRFLPDSSQVPKWIADEKKNLPDAPALSAMRASTCFNCHAVKSKVIGPSFEAVAKRYASDAAAADKLARRIISGSKGVWSEVEMPPHPELSIAQAKQMSQWILKNGADPRVQWLVGLDGSFTTREAPQKDPGKAVYLLTASYTDHGEGSPAGNSHRGSHTIVLRAR